MTRTLTFAAAVVVYTVLASALVSHQGRLHRDSLRQEAQGNGPGDRSATTTPPAPEPPATPTPNPTPSVSVKAAPPAPSPAPEPAKPAVSTELANVIPKRTPTPSPDSASPSVAKGAEPAAKPLPPVVVPPPQPHWTDGRDLNTLSVDEETRLGAELHAKLTTVLPIDDQGDLQRLHRAADRILAGRDRKTLAYHFFVLNSSEIFCASLPGGIIYVSKGFLQFAGEATDPEEDYVLEFAIAHEIAHVDMKHALRVATVGQAAAKGKPTGAMAGLLVPLLFGYPDADEFAADAWASRQLSSNLKRTRRETRMFLTRLEGLAERQGYKNGRKPLNGLVLVENHYRAHPAAWLRKEKLNALLGPTAAVPPPVSR